MAFEVIVVDNRTALQTSAQVEARHWLAAVAACVAHSGAPPLQWGSVHVLVAPDGVQTLLDGAQQRTLRVRRLSDAEIRRSQAIRAPTGAHVAVGGPPRPAGFTDPSTGQVRRVSVSLPQQPKPAAPVAEAKVVSSLQSQAPAPAPAPADSAWIQPPAPAASTVDASALEDIFLESPGLLEEARDLDDAAARLLDLTLRKIPAEGGAIFLSEEPGQPMVCCAAQGQWAANFRRVRLSAERGLAAACLQTGLRFALVQPRQDPRWTPDLEQAGIQENTLLVCPVQQERTYGVVVLVNRQHAPAFTAGDASAAEYVGRQLGEYIQVLLEGQG
jgi:hypothetical protein